MFQDARGGAGQSFTWKIDLTQLPALWRSASLWRQRFLPAGVGARSLARAETRADRGELRAQSEKTDVLGGQWKRQRAKPEAVWKMHLCALRHERLVHLHFRCYGQEAVAVNPIITCCKYIFIIIWNGFLWSCAPSVLLFGMFINPFSLHCIK